MKTEKASKIIEHVSTYGDTTMSFTFNKQTRKLLIQSDDKNDSDNNTKHIIYVDNVNYVGGDLHRLKFSFKDGGKASFVNIETSIISKIINMIFDDKGKI